MSAAKVIPLQRPTNQAEREWRAWALEMRHLYGQDAMLLTPEQAASCAAQGDRVHDELSRELDAFRFARMLFG